MTSYLRSWLAGATVEESSPDPPIPTFTRVSPPPDEDEGSDTETEAYDDTPPAFPSLSSAQRMKSSIPAILTDSQRMPPPPLPHLAVRVPGVKPARSNEASSSLGVLATTVRPVRPTKKRDKVALAPGHSALDWASLKLSGTDLRVRVYSKKFHCWSRLGDHMLMSSLMNS